MAIPIPQQDTQSVFPNVPGDPLRVDASPIAAGGLRVAGGVEDIGAAIGQGSDVLAKHALAFQGMQNEAAAKDADTKGIVAIGDLETKYLSLEGKNRVDAYPKYRQDLQNLRTNLLAGMPNPAAARMFDAVFAQRVGYSIISGSRAAAEANRQYLTSTSEARVQAILDDATRHYNDPRVFQQALGTMVDEAQQQGGMMGWSPEVTKQHADQYVSEAWKARLLQMTDDDPHAALKVYEANSDKLDAQGNVQVDHAIRTAIKVQASEARATADHAMALADHNLRIMQDHNASVLWQAQFDGKLDLKTLEKYRDDLSQSDFTALGHAVTGEGAQHNDSEAIITLTQSAAREDPEIFGEDAAQMLRNKQITPAKYQEFVGTNRTLMKDDQAPSAFRSGRELIMQSLDPGALSGVGATALRGVRAQAIQEFNQWQILNKGATYQQVINQANSIITRGQFINYKGMTMSLLLPRFYVGDRANVTVEGLNAAEAKALETYDHAAISHTGFGDIELANELTLIKQWRDALAKMPAGGKVPDTPPSDTAQPPVNPANPGGQ